jgi:transcriptional regulator
MTERQKQALRLYLSGKTQKEIAAIMRITQGSVSKILNRATKGHRKPTKNIPSHKIYKYSDDIDLYTKNQY